LAALETRLQDAGFTDYEARAYVALLKKSPQTGYELAKTSRVPRSNVYEVLNKLEFRGAATKIVALDSVRYTAVDPETVLLRMKNSFSTMIHDIESQLKMLSCANEDAHVESFQGYDNLIAFTTSLVIKAQRKLVLAVHPSEAMQVQVALHSAFERGVSIHTLCLHGCADACSACRGELHRDPFKRPTQGRWVIVVTDDHSLVAGEIQGDSVAGFRTKLPLLAKIAGLYIEQSMLFARLTSHGRLSFDDLPSSATIV
jgi:sugar-specific transcriptional regulator TrmB